MKSQIRTFTLIELMIVIAIIAVVAAIAIPNLLESRKHANSGSAIESLKTIITTQSLFREGDKEDDGLYDYGTLTEMDNANLIDKHLGTGTKQGYIFVTSAGTASTDYIFYATGNPAILGSSGDRAFVTNHEGVIYWTVNTTIPWAPMTANATIPNGVVPVR